MKFYYTSMDTDREPVIHQLRVVLDGIIPLIWRRLLVPGDYSIAELHFILQIAFDWDDRNLHRFFIHGKDYGIYHSGGMSFSDDPYQVKLADFKFRKSEKFGSSRKRVQNRLDADLNAFQLLMRFFPLLISDSALLACTRFHDEPNLLKLINFDCI